MSLINYPQALDELAEQCHDITESKGFFDNDFGDFAQVIIQIALIGTEVSELLEVHREAYTDGPEDSGIGMTPMQETDFTDELADIIIRSLDLAGYLDLSIGTAVLTKMEKNQRRPRKHGKRY